MTPEQCLEFSRALAPVLAASRQAWRNGRLSSVNLVASFVCKSLQWLKPQDWKGARLQTKADFSPSSVDIFRCFSFRGLPLSVNRSLWSWADGTYPLQLFFHVPSTDEVLRQQSQGVRCVTVLTQPEELSSYVLNERDPLSFTLHDLIHADHFFHDPVQRQVQIGFSRWLQNLWHEAELQSHRQNRPDFAARFEYACADMNSHGAHLVKYLKAVFCQEGLDGFLQAQAPGFDFSVDFVEALEAINSPKENERHLLTLQNELLSKGAVHSQNQKSDGISFWQIIPV